jgi:hypothetical protein
MDHMIETIVALGLIGLGVTLIGIVLWARQKQDAYYARLWEAKREGYREVRKPVSPDIFGSWEQIDFHERDTLPKISVGWEGRA